MGTRLLLAAFVIPVVEGALLLMRFAQAHEAVTEEPCGTMIFRRIRHLLIFGIVLAAASQAYSPTGWTREEYQAFNAMFLGDSRGT